MKKSINLYFNYENPVKEKIEKIKEVGYDEFFTGVYDDGLDMSFQEQCTFAKTVGLECTMIHCRYDENLIHYFWEDCLQGEDLLFDYCSQIRKAKGLTKNFVVHLNADKNQKQSNIGLKRIEKMLQVCEECGLNLCIENLYSETEIPYIFKNINHNRLKICFDIGHKNYLTPNFEVLKIFHKYVEVVHVHDNHGIKDEHLICGKGNIDWKLFIKELKKIPNIVLSAEVKYGDGDCTKFLKEVFDGLSMIENFLK